MKTLLTALFLIAAAGTIVVAPSPSEATSGAKIDREANETLHSFVRQIAGARELANKAAGILVFPSVVKAGFGFGGEYGEGLLIVGKRPAGYYNMIIPATIDECCGNVECQYTRNASI